MEDRRGEPFEVRDMVPSDRVALEAMYAGFEPKRGAQGLPPAHAEGIRRWLDRVLAGGTHLLAVCAGRICGHVMLVPTNGDAVELANFVHQAWRNRGIGTALNRVAVDRARAAGVRRVWLCVEPSNRAALKSYERAGFRILPGGEWAPELEMALDLDDVA
jgi:RimJ/RimL family protein N-acetyltransferase